VKCQICHCEIKYKGRGRHPLYCEDCAYLVKLDYDRLYSFLHYQKKRRRGLFLGTNNFSPHRQRDFKLEHNLILKQIYKIGFKRQFT